jgi:hypothetical protein
MILPHYSYLLAGAQNDQFGAARTAGMTIEVATKIGGSARGYSAEFASLAAR